MAYPVYVPDITSELAEAIEHEAERAKVAWPGNTHLLAALVEEVGELAQAYLQAKPQDEIVKEAIQVACLAIRIAGEGDAAFDGWADTGGAG